MSILTNSAVTKNFGVSDGLHVMHISIQNSDVTGTIIKHDNWNKIMFLEISAINASTSNPPSLDSSHRGTILTRTDLATDGSNTDTGMNNSHASDAKNILIHKTSGEWRLRHTSHGMNYDYVVVFVLAST